MQFVENAYRKYDRKNAGLEEEYLGAVSYCSCCSEVWWLTYDHQHRQSTPVRPRRTTRIHSDSRRNKDHNHSLKDHEHNTRLATNIHKSRSRETPGSEETLRNSVEVGALAMRLRLIEIRARLGEVVDEEGRHADLGADVRELRCDTPEERVLLAQRLVDVARGDGGHLGLVGHVRVRDFGDGREVENHCEDGDEAGNAEVDPLHGLKRLSISADVLEDDLGGEYGSDY
jgi:hypothetical protein